MQPTDGIMPTDCHPDKRIVFHPTVTFQGVMLIYNQEGKIKHRIMLF